MNHERTIRMTQESLLTTQTKKLSGNKMSIIHEKSIIIRTILFNEITNMEMEKIGIEKSTLRHVYSKE